MKKIKKFIDALPVVRSIARKISALFKRLFFTSSDQYWKKRYCKGAGSGDGSYGVLATFKADVLNSFVEQNHIKSVIEYGCGDGNQLSMATYPSYIGLDISPASLMACIERFRNDPSKSFFLYNPNTFQDNHSLFRAEMALSLDVIYHLVEDSLYELHMQHLFISAERYVVIYSSNTDRTIFLDYPHVKHRKFSDWIERENPEWKLIKKVPNKYPYQGLGKMGSWSDFFVYEKT